MSVAPRRTITREWVADTRDRDLIGRLLQQLGVDPNDACSAHFDACDGGIQVRVTTFVRPTARPAEESFNEPSPRPSRLRS